MRHRYVLPFVAGALALVLSSGGALAQAFTNTDWPAHRADAQRTGGNHSDDPNLTTPAVVPPLKDRVWVWPPTADLPAEFVVDNGTGANFRTLDNRIYTNATGQTFTVNGNGWVYPATGERGGGAWPFTADVTDKLGDYVAVEAATSSVLANIQLTTLQALPNIWAEMADPSGASTLYKRINDELTTNGTVYARWSMGGRYPLGTMQGTNAVGNRALPGNTRYAVYVNFPSSGTTINGTIRPNVDHVMVRVSWGADVNDPRTSRIFMMSFGETGGYWARVRTGPGDDRYFPYDGTNPLVVTLYNLTPDDVTDTNLYSARPIVVADAVRFVPETNRGDIHTPAVSAMFPPGATRYPPNAAQNVQLTYFGREETVGPPMASNNVNTGALSGYPQIPADPTLPPGANNPFVADRSGSVRQAVFYCIEDDIATTATGAPIAAQSHYAQLRWRFVAQSVQVASATVDNSQAAPYFGTTGNWQTIANPNQDPYGADFLRTQVDKNGVDATAVWTAALPGGKPATAYTVLVWVPAGVNANNYTSAAHYIVHMASGDQDLYLNQQQPAGVTTPVGEWRVLTSGVHFPQATFNGNTAIVGSVTLQNDQAAAETGSFVVADALRFVPDSSASNSGVVASPLLANVTYASGVRPVVYFATTDGHVWALDAMGVGNGSTLTSALWVYPSVANPAIPVATLTGPQDDPNYKPDPESNRATQGIDGDLVKTTVGGQDVYTVDNKVPDLGSFVSSPTYVVVLKQIQPPPAAPTPIPMLVVGNTNGRIYAFDPAGRTLNGDPYPASIAVADTPGIPGTTRRIMTWPTIARDKWLQAGGSTLGGGSFAKYTDDPARTSFTASLTAPVPDANAGVGYVIAGAGDGHVYCVDLHTLDVKERISNPNNNGAFRWEYPAGTAALDAITETGTLTPAGDKFIFSAGGRVYAINNPATQAKGEATALWTYPFTATPPGNPGAADQPALDTPFTAPAWRANVGTNAEMVYVANTDGRIFAIDATSQNTNAAAPAVLWTSAAYGSTRASAVFIPWLQSQATYAAVASGPAILLPMDNGAVAGFAAADGRVLWAMPDAYTGQVAAIDTSGNLTTTVTNSAWRGADVTLANYWMYQGDEGNQDTGEVNGQMRAYANSSIGMVTPGEPTIQPDQRSADMRLVNIWTDAVHARFGLAQNANNATSPYTERGNTRPNGQGGFLVYEWGDSIQVAAWGAYSRNSNPPQVTFRLSSGATARPPVTVGALRDWAYAGADLAVYNPADGTALPAWAWVAKTSFPLDRGSQADPQSPGTRYTVTAQITTQVRGAMMTSPQLSVGQQFPGPPTTADPAQTPLPTDDPNNVGAARPMALAHPMAITTRGFQFGGQKIGTNVPNIMGWTDGVPADEANMDLTEVMANGNRLATVSNNTITTTSIKGIVAPVGLVAHGSSALYRGVDNAGNPGPAFFVADRSNLYKRGHGLNNVRVDRTDMRWAWDPNDATQQATANVMNPLPWESFPYHDPATGGLMPQNASPDYPDVARTRMTYQVNGIDIGTRPATLPPAQVDSSGNKVLQPVEVSLLVNVPRYQPANINRFIGDVNGGTSTGLTNGLLAPMMVSTGTDPTAGANQSLYRLLAPSAGYIARARIFIDSSGTGQFTSSISQAVGQQAQTQQVAVAPRQDVYRSTRVGIGVPPDVRLRTEEQTIDLGTAPHAEGFAPNVPFAPSGMGPYNGNAPLSTFLSPWDRPGTQRFFAPFTVKNTGNVNLVNLRVAKVIGLPAPATVTNVTNWVGFLSDQVESFTNPFTGRWWSQALPQIWSVPFNNVGPTAAGNLGMVTSLDHSNAAVNFETDYNARYGTANFWPVPNPYVPANNVLGSPWATDTQPRPTLHKARPDDAVPTVLSMPDVAYGDPQGLLQTVMAGRQAAGLPADVRPEIGVAVPMGTPSGTYSASVNVFEDRTPDQWRTWLAWYNQQNGNQTGPTNVAADDDGIMNAYRGSNGQMTTAEALSDPAFTLKVTVREARLTNGVTPGSAPQLDMRAVGAPAFGANIQPTAQRDPTTGNMFLYWASNRQVPAGTQPTSDSPWFLNYSRLGSVSTSAFGPIDWSFANTSQWWNPLPQALQYPDPTQAAQLFPSDVSSSAGQPAVAGVVVPNTLRNYSPVLAHDDGNTSAPFWLFWQGTAGKSSTAGGGNATAVDSRTFYVPLKADGTPDTSVNGGLPYSFRNDPELPRFAPTPLILTATGGGTYNYLFWYGGPRGRTRLYYNVTANLANPGAWSGDAELPMPGSLSWAADPVAIHGRVYAAGQFSDCVDLVYTGVLSGRNQAETILTRYAVLGNGRLTVMGLPQVDNELMVRQGNTQTWATRDISWVIRYPNRQLIDGNGVPPYAILVNGTSIIPAKGTPSYADPVYDQPTGRVFWNSTLGGQMVIDSQAGTLTFLGTAPGPRDQVTITYQPQALRLNSSRGDTGALAVPAGWGGDVGFAQRPFVTATGSNTGPAAFIDRSTNPRLKYILSPPANGATPLTRLWLIYRKSNANITAPAALYYKTLRLMVRLPRGVIRDVDQNGNYIIGNHVRISGNRGPVEVDWVRGRLYFTEVDEGNVVTVNFDYGRDANGNPLTVPDTQYRVAWRDELTTAVQPADQPTNESVLPTDTAVNEGQVSAFKDPIADKVWVFWASTRAGTTDLYYMTVSPAIYPQASVP